MVPILSAKLDQFIVHTVALSNFYPFPVLRIINHDDVIKWKHFLRNWPFVRGIHRSPVNSLQKGQWRGVLVFSLICAWINSWTNNRGDGGALRRLCAHFDVNVMSIQQFTSSLGPLLLTLINFNSAWISNHMFKLQQVISSHTFQWM